MSDNSKNNLESQEIDLSLISKKIGEFFENISTNIFKGILYLKRNLVIIGVLFVLGAAIGFYLDKTKKIYENQIIVSPNFGSTDYLYSKVKLLNSKIAENDTVFLKKVVGIQDTKHLLEIEIKPITDVYKFVENNEQNFEMIKLMAEDGDIKKILQESMTSKNYPFQTVIFTTSSKTSFEKTVNPILKYLNDSQYFSTIQKESINNLKIKIAQNDATLAQIDGLLNSFSDKVNQSGKNDKLVYYNENSQLNDVLKTKDDLIREQGYNRISLVNCDKIIKDKNTSINIRKMQVIGGKFKFFLPLSFILLFIFIGIFRAYYNRQMAKLNQ